MDIIFIDIKSFDCESCGGTFNLELMSRNFGIYSELFLCPTCDSVEGISILLDRERRAVDRLAGVLASAKIRWCPNSTEKYCNELGTCPDAAKRQACCAEWAKKGGEEHENAIA